MAGELNPTRVLAVLNKSGAPRLGISHPDLPDVLVVDPECPEKLDLRGQVCLAGADTFGSLWSDLELALCAALDASRDEVREILADWEGQAVAQPDRFPANRQNPASIESSNSQWWFAHHPALPTPIRFNPRDPGTIALASSSSYATGRAMLGGQLWRDLHGALMRDANLPERQAENIAEAWEAWSYGNAPVFPVERIGNA
ncbi:hypothetical protein [Acidimangrovimonas pyrenivorans]|uniref:Uncharacterized protein n=1 Tax=Acidimangrovimonas pyrenivorans TaxID=2030798 RepID=A0ABV7AD63_9RHOB